MAKFTFAISVSILAFCYVSAAPKPVADYTADEELQNFQKFTLSLPSNSRLDELTEAYGAAVESPFGVGFMLANIKAKVWNMPDDGVNQALHISPKGDVAYQYSRLTGHIFVSGGDIPENYLFAPNKSSQVILTDSAKTLITQFFETDFINDWKTSTQLMNKEISETTNGKLKDQLIPTKNILGGVFDRFTEGYYVNTDHYKNTWKNGWVKAEERKISDGTSLPFLQAEGKFPLLETETFTAVAIQIGDKETRRFAVFVLPKNGDLKNYEKFLSLNPFTTSVSTETKKVLLPSLKVTTLNQHYKGLEKLGVKNTFCLPGDEPTPDGGIKKAGGRAKYIAMRPFYGSPIVQAGHLEITSDFIEVASATGMTIKSLEKVVAQDDHLFGKTDKEIPSQPTTTASGSSSGKTGTVVGGRKTRSVKGSSSSSATATSTNKTPAAAITTKKPATASDSNSIIFDKPFFWYIHDKDLGPLYYGTVASMSTYRQRTEDPEEPVDLVKVFSWNCP